MDGQYHRASMGPQKFICGNEHVVSFKRTKTFRFNGAAEIHLRKFIGPSGSGKTTIGFNGAAEIHLRKLSRCRPPMISSYCFNGAAEIHLRKSFPTWELRSPVACFNGAAEIHLRKFRNGLDKHAHLLASMGPQKFICGNSSGPVASAGSGGLQWGRRNSSAEMLMGKA